MVVLHDNGLSSLKPWKIARLQVFMLVDCCGERIYFTAFAGQVFFTFRRGITKTRAPTGGCPYNHKKGAGFKPTPTLRNRKTPF
jgi:hypothetical protein